MTLLTRRSLLDNAAKGGAALAATGLVAGCGSSSSSPGTSTASETGLTPRHGGILRVGVTGGGSSDSVDPNITTTNADVARIIPLYDCLFWMNKEGLPYLALAEEATPNKDATVWTIRLRQGVTFHNGKELTADDGIFSVTRMLDPKAPSVSAILLTSLKTSEIKKLDKYTFTIPFGTPHATLVEDLAWLGGIYVIPVGYDPRKPIGTGPFEYVSFTPGQQSVMKRNPNYWVTPEPYADQLIITDYSDETSQVDALLGGDIDLAPGLSSVSLATVSQEQALTISPGGQFTPFTMRVDVAPFSDVRVRQAFRLTVDRQKMLEQVYEGHGFVANDIFSIWDPVYDHSIPQRPYDPEQAKSLLKAAGHDGLTVTLVTSQVNPGAVQMAEVFAQQAGAAGIQVKLQQITPTEMYGPNYLKWVFAQDVGGYSPYLATVPFDFLGPASVFNETHFNDPHYTSLYEEAVATLDTAKRTELCHEMQMIDWSQGGYIIAMFTSVLDGHGKNVHGLVPAKTGTSLNNWNFAQPWIA
jgi:peptide/nickel transport system substrate-binding protein